MVINEMILSKFKSATELFHEFDKRVGILSHSCYFFKQRKYQRLKI